MIASIINIKQINFETNIGLVSSIFSIGILIALPIAFALEVYIINKNKYKVDNEEF